MQKNNWQTKKLGDVCRFVRGPFGGSLKKSIFVNEGYLVYEQYHAINNDFNFGRYFIDEKKFKEMERFEVFPGDLLISSSGTMGKIAIAPSNIKKGIINQALLKLTPNSSALDRYFLKYLLQTDHIRDKYFTDQRGAAIQNIASVKSFKEMIVNLPNLLEQKRIVNVLNETFEKIDQAMENLRENLQNSRDLFKSYLQNIITNPDSDWEKKTLADVYDVRDGTHDSPKYQKEGFPLITSKNLKKDLLNFQNVNYISEKDFFNINKRSKVDKGDILFAMIGTIGNSVVIQDEPNFAIKNVALFKIPKGQNSYFLKYYLDSKITIDKMIVDAKGTTQKFVGLGYLRGFPILLPPLNTQKAVVKKLDLFSTKTKKLKKIYKQKLADLEELKKSILNEAFSGRL